MRCKLLIVLAGILTLGAVTPAQHSALFARLRAFHDYEQKIDLKILQAGQSPEVKRFAGMTLGDASGLDQSLDNLAKDMDLPIGTYAPETPAEQQQQQELAEAAAALDARTGAAADKAYLNLQSKFQADVLAAVTDAAAQEDDPQVSALLADYKGKASAHSESVKTLLDELANGTLDTGSSSGANGSGGNGNGNGNGDGHGNGNGNGNSNPSGGNGNGNGNGNGSGNGNGNGNGNGGTTCVSVCNCGVSAGRLAPAPAWLTDG